MAFPRMMCLQLAFGRGMATDNPRSDVSNAEGIVGDGGPAMQKALLEMVAQHVHKDYIEMIEWLS